MFLSVMSDASSLQVSFSAPPIRRWFVRKANNDFKNMSVLRPTRAGCTYGSSKAGAAATPLPRGQAEPANASGLDISNDNENENDIAIDSDNENHDDDDNNETENDENDDTDDDDNDDHRNVETLKKRMRTPKNPLSFNSGCAFT